MNRLVPLVCFVGVMCSGVAAEAQQKDRAREIARINEVLDQARQAMGAVHDYRGTLIKRERFGDELVEETLTFKFSRPYKVYVKYLEPNPGREGIYVRGWNRGKVRAHKGSTPDVAVSLDPRGRIAMENKHHPITSFGLERMLVVSTRNIHKGIARGDTKLALTDGRFVYGEPTRCIEVESKPGEGRRVVVRRDENLWQLAERVGQNMYVILHHNEDIDSPTDVRPGQEVFVPFHYASRGRYCFSMVTFLLIKTTSWDHYGKLYEAYEHPTLELNSGLTDADFDPRNEEYDF